LIIPHGSFTLYLYRPRKFTLSLQLLRSADEVIDQQLPSHRLRVEQGFAGLGTAQRVAAPMPCAQAFKRMSTPGLNRQQKMMGVTVTFVETANTDAGFGSSRLDMLRRRERDGLRQ
jgi:hypothetical protein